MSKLIWKLRYALLMRKVSGISMSFSWQSASAWVEAYGIEYTPWEAVQEEISCWDAA